MAVGAQCTVLEGVCCKPFEVLPEYLPEVIVLEVGKSVLKRFVAYIVTDICERKAFGLQVDSSFPFDSRLFQDGSFVSHCKRMFDLSVVSLI